MPSFLPRYTSSYEFDDARFVLVGALRKKRLCRRRHHCLAEQHLRKNIEAISSSRNKLKNLLKMCHLFHIKKLSLLLGEEEICVLKAYPHSV